jgi:hypothetical protein
VPIEQRPLGQADGLALAALGVALVTLGWTVYLDTRLRKLEGRREQRESGYVLSLAPGDHMQWARDHPFESPLISRIPRNSRRLPLRSSNLL